MMELVHLSAQRTVLAVDMGSHSIFASDMMH